MARGAQQEVPPLKGKQSLALDGNLFQLQLLPPPGQVGEEQHDDSTHQGAPHKASQLAALRRAGCVMRGKRA